MAETLTIDPNSPAEIVGESEGVQLTADEQDSLQVGEEMSNQQEQLLAGKYKTAEELEKAYGELQRKLGEKGDEDNETTSESEVQETEEVSEEESETTEVSEGAQLITDASSEYWENDGKLTPETIEKFSSMSSKDLVNAYMELQANNPDALGNNQESVQDITESTINEVKNFAGGEQAYNNLVQWAGNNLDQKSIDAFDSIINTGTVAAIKIAVSGLKQQYQDANGYEGTMLSGKAPKAESQDVFRSQAELVRAMSDRRYDQDPAYRQDVIAKLERSDNLAF
tara:strand:- start:745 stop:1593 length:849 start_codon:yes stop_codon:yes gene_type:complete